MTRFLLAGLSFVAMLPRINADTSTGSQSYAQSPSSDFFGDIEVTATGLLLSETGVPACRLIGDIPFPFAFPLDSGDCQPTDTFNVNATLAAGGEPEGPLFLLSLMALPKPPDGSLLTVSPEASTALPEERSSGWLLISISTAIVLIAGTRVLRVRRTSANRM
jgi:hypothetical protein